MKQASAFPPNFVHSLDATHMLLTAIETHRRGLTFAAVHDSYWTHACDIDAMSTVIRDTFIDLHSSDMLSKLQAEFRQRYKGYRIPIFHLTKNSTLGKKLQQAGVRIKVTPEQAAQLSAVSHLLEVSDEVDASTSSVHEGDLVPLPSAAEITKELMKMEKESMQEEAASESESSLASASASEGERDGVAVTAKEWDEKERAKEEKAKEEALKHKDEQMAALANKFVNLTDCLPPLPEKGSFDVRDIRKSLYFFS